MAYEKTNWQDTLRDAQGNIIQKGTPLNAQALGKIEDGIVGAEQKIDNEISQVAQQLAQTVKKDDTLTMANMGQDVKEAMTGGSVAVVGKNTVLKDNIVDNQVTPTKLSFAKQGANKFLGEYHNFAVLTDGKFINDANSMTAIIPVVPGKTYYFRKFSGNRMRLAWHKTKPSPTSVAQTSDYFVGDTINGTGYKAPVDAYYAIYTVSNQIIEPPLLNVTENDSTTFIGYDFLNESNISGLSKLLYSLKKPQVQLYGNYPLIDINYNTRVISINSSVRVLYEGKRTVIANSSVPMLANTEDLYQLLYFNTDNLKVELIYFTISTALEFNQRPIALIHPTDPQKVDLIDLSRIHVNGTPFTRSHISNEIKSIKSSITNLEGNSSGARYFFLDEIDGIYDKPIGLTNVASGQTFVLETSKHTDIYAIYDDLVNRYPSYVSRSLLGNDTTGLPIYQYKFTTPSIDNQSNYPHKKLKIILTSAIHGYEQGSAWCLAQFFKDLCDNHTTKKQLEFMRWNVDFVVVPVCNPYGYNNNQRTNVNLVDLNRNFNANWTLTTVDGDINGYYSGPSPASEVETQILQAFLDANLDAEYYIDYHNIAGGYPLFYLYDSSASTIAHNTFKTLSRKWKSNYPNAPQDGTLFGYVKTGVNACSAKYWVNKGLKSFVFETPWQMPFGGAKYDKITIETGVEAFGNTLITILKSIR